MFQNGQSGLSRYISLYNHANLVIVPSQAMADFLQSNGLTVEKVVIQQMWDFPVAVDKTINPHFQNRLHFIENVTSISRPFVRNWNYDKVQLSVTANENECNWAQGKNIGFLGWFHNDELLVNELRKQGGFGLVWHDDPWWVEYMKLNAGYKIGTYLAAGIPVVINRSKAEKDIIIRKNLGLVVDSLDEAVEKISGMNEKTYSQMVQDIGQFSDLIREGYFTRKLLTDAVFRLIHD